MFICKINSLTPGRCVSNNKRAILTHCDIVLKWISQNRKNAKSALPQVMAWCREAKRTIFWIGVDQDLTIRLEMGSLGPIELCYKSYWYFAIRYLHIEKQHGILLMTNTCIIIPLEISYFLIQCRKWHTTCPCGTEKNRVVSTISWLALGRNFSDWCIKCCSDSG